MGILISKSDFVGKYELAKSINDKIDSYILEYESDLLIDLLGVELYNLFIADLVNQVPVDPIYLKIYNDFNEKIGCFIFKSKGIKDMLLSSIFFLYVRDYENKQTMNGSVNQITEVSTKSNLTFLYNHENNCISTYKSIQTYIINNKDVYPTFQGVVKSFSSPY